MSMILPTKRLSEQRSLLGMGALILQQLRAPKDISRLWEDVKRAYLASPSSNGSKTQSAQTFTYEWFVLALDFLFLVDAISVEDGRVRKRRAVRAALATQQERVQHVAMEASSTYKARQRTVGKVEDQPQKRKARLSH